MNLKMKCLTFIALLGLSITGYSNHNDVKAWKFDSHQINTLKQAKDKCNKKNFDGNICAAIVWHESSAGKNKNAGESVGNFHNLISTVKKREVIWKKTNNPKYTGITSGSQVKNKLLTSMDYEIKHSLAQLQECKNHLVKINKFTNKNMLSCYNAGFNFKSSKGQFYANNVLKKYNHLKTNGIN